MSWVTRAVAARDAAAASAKADADRQAALTDAFLDSWVAWRQSCEQVQAAYRRWCDCPPRDRPAAFRVYRSALDGEQSTARRYRERATALRSGRAAVSGLAPKRQPLSTLERRSS
jgi:hypothetical protein